ncbi:MAG: hypothetical protein ACRYFS_15500 [Janthinobacterium lividum]
MSDQQAIPMPQAINKDVMANLGVMKLNSNVVATAFNHPATGIPTDEKGHDGEHKEVGEPYNDEDLAKLSEEFTVHHSQPKEGHPDPLRTLTTQKIALDRQWQPGTTVLIQAVCLGQTLRCLLVDNGTKFVQSNSGS